LRKEIVSSILGGELTKPTRPLISVLQMFTKQTLQNTTEKHFSKVVSAPKFLKEK